MQQTGIVKETKHGVASVMITRSSACGESCASCGLCPGQTAVVEAQNGVNAAAGDTVIIDMPDKKVLGAAFLVYIVPLIFLIAGYFLGGVIFKTEAMSIVSGLFLMALSFLIIAASDRKIKKHCTHRIERIVTEETR